MHMYINMYIYIYISYVYIYICTCICICTLIHTSWMHVQVRTSMASNDFIHIILHLVTAQLDPRDPPRDPGPSRQSSRWSGRSKPAERCKFPTSQHQPARKGQLVKLSWAWSMGRIPGSENGGTGLDKAIVCRNIPLHWPYINLIYGRSVGTSNQSVPESWPLSQLTIKK